jgi:hypothetical protein
MDSTATSVAIPNANDSSSATIASPSPAGAPADSLLGTSDSTAQDATKRIQVVRRQFKYREQVGYALAMMLFIAIIMTSSQSWNP